MIGGCHGRKRPWHPASLRPHLGGAMATLAWPCWPSRRSHAHASVSMAPTLNTYGSTDPTVCCREGRLFGNRGVPNSTLEYIPPDGLAEFARTGHFFLGKSTSGFDFRTNLIHTVLGGLEDCESRMRVLRGAPDRRGCPSRVFREVGKTRQLKRKGLPGGFRAEARDSLFPFVCLTHVWTVVVGPKRAGGRVSWHVTGFPDLTEHRLRGGSRDGRI